MAHDIIDGQVFEVEYPFVRTTYESYDEDGPQTLQSWRPGCEYEPCGPYCEGTETVADGVGKQILTVVATFKPGRYPERVFYTVKWVTPEGAAFGKGGLHIATVEKFRRLTRGYMAGDPDYAWRIREAEEAAA